MAERVDRDWLKQQLAKVGVDGAVFFAVVARAWQFVSGPITLLLMALYFSPEMRGYFYTFGTILALQVFFELSLHIVLISVASHEWAHLRLNDQGQIEGDDAAHARLMALGRTSLRWYGVAAILFVICCGIGGTIFLGQESLPMSQWLGPWIALVVLTGGLLCCQPLTSLLEGCDQLAIVNRYRLRQSLTGSLIVWGMILSGLGLWAAAGSSAVRLFWEVRLVAFRYRGFFRDLFRSTGQHLIDWKQEVWPMQWRLGLQGVATWWAMQLLTPVMFQYHGDVVAGRMGMTWSILSSLQAAAFAWVEARRPKFGQLIATRDFSNLDQLFFRSSAQSIVILLTGVLLFWGCLFGLNQLEIPLAVKIADALLPPLPAAVLCLGMSLFQIPVCLAVYIRAHKRELFLVPSLILCGMIGVLVLTFGKSHGALGASLAWTGSIGLFQFPVWTVIWTKFRKNARPAHLP